MKTEQAVLLEGSTNYQACPTNRGSLMDGLRGLDTGFSGFEYDDYLEPDFTIGYGRDANQISKTCGHSNDGSPVTEDSPSFSPLTRSFQQEASVFSSYDNDSSKCADFTLFDVDPALISLVPSWDALPPRLNFVAHDSMIGQNQNEEINMKAQYCREISSLNSHHDTTISDLMACYWQPEPLANCQETSSFLIHKAPISNGNVGLRF